MDDYLNLQFKEGLTSHAGATYRNLQKLGVGGTAEPYLMLSTSGALRGQLFAVKVFRRSSKPEWQRYFLDEVKFLQSCDHPAVMKVFDEGLHLDNHPFVVAEYLPSTLGGVLRTAPPMMAKMGYALQMISALEYLSSDDVAVIHRDIKPANVFIKGGACVLGDFGLMKRAVADPDIDRDWLKASLGPRMPRNYRTPDLVDYYKGGAAPTGKSDVFQLGLVFAQMFSGSNPQKPMTANDYTEPVELVPYFIPGGLGKPLKDLIDPMLDLDPNGRPTPASLIERWQDLFLEASRRAHALDGRVF